MIKSILGILLIMVLAAIGADYLTCGYGNDIRRNIREMFKINTPIMPEHTNGKNP